MLLLVCAGADTGGQDGAAALETAVSRGLPQTVQALLQCGVTPPETLPEEVSSEGY